MGITDYRDFHGQIQALSRVIFKNSQQVKSGVNYISTNKGGYVFHFLSQ